MRETLELFARDFDPHLASCLKPDGFVPEVLVESIRYSALAPGKRIRPFLVVRCCELVGGTRDDAWPAACAVECIHAFSLIHDDLPAMDDDDLRRGRPTCHKKFGEGMAILAGDALVSLAFERLASCGYDDSIVSSVVCELARASGWRGMIGGQASDLVGEKAAPDVNLVRSIHERKTAALLTASCRIGAIVGRADAATRDRLGAYGHALGLAFQIADDLLDVSGTTAALGKRVGKDAEHGKQTYPRSVGVTESRRALEEALADAVSAIEAFGDRADDLRALARFIGSRHY